MSTPFRRRDLDPVRVTLILRDREIEGSIHVEHDPEARFSDVWESFRRTHESRKYFPVTDATIRGSSAPEKTVELIVVDRDEIIAVIPAEPD